MRLHRARRSASAAVAAAALLCVLASCSTSSTPSQTSSPTTTTAATTTAALATACADAAALKSSLEALTQVKPLQDGLTALNTAIANVKTNLGVAAASASAVLQPAVDQVKTAFAGLQTAASGLTADNLKEKAPSITSAITQIGTATTALATTLTQNCPGS